MATSPKNAVPSPGAARPNSRSPPTSPPPLDPIEYRYMYETNKSPTTLLDALLRAIASYIIREIGDPCQRELTPDKLAAFYKAVGGDYDSLFVQTDSQSISYIWQLTGCQHSLQPTDNDFDPPSVPALTPRGFSRWESLEILLGPEEHVPFLQFAVKNWNLKHPESGKPFPPDLPKSVFPAKPDDDVDRWHRNCARQLRTDASREREAAANSGPEPDHCEPKPEPRFNYVRPKPYQRPQQHPEPTFFHRSERSVPYSHVPGRPGGGVGGRRASRVSPERHHADSRFEDGERRRSFSDPKEVPRSEPTSYPRGAPYLDPHAAKRPEPARRNSQQRPSSPDSSDEGPIPPRTRKHDDSPPCVPRYADASVPPQRSPPPMYRHRPPGDDRRRGAPSPTFREKVSETFSNILPNGLGSDRPRSVRRPSYNGDPRTRRRDFPPSRLSRSHSDLESDPSSEAEGSDDEHRRMRRDKERDRARESRGRPRDFDREEERRDRPYRRRPEAERRTSSHADMDRRRDQPPWDPRARDQARDDKRRWDKRGPHDDRDVSPMSGIPRGRYAEEMHA